MDFDPHRIDGVGKQRGRADQPDFGAECRQQMNVGAGHAAVGDIAADGDLQPLDPADAAFDRQCVEKRLGRMLVPAVTGIDHGSVDMLAQKLRGTRTIVPDNQYMRMHCVQRRRRVEQRLALFHR